jgi:hemerythrin-like domain-containing protein
VLKINRKQGAPAFVPDFTDPLGLLVRCHGKIEAQLGALERATRVLRDGRAGSFPEVFGAIAAAQAHFAGPGTKHTADEEESLFPRLRRYGGPSERGVLHALEELEAQHRVADRAHADFDLLVERMTRGAVPSQRDVDALAMCVDALASLYGPHILLENEVIFPAAAQVLPPEEILAVGQEMRARRAGMLVGVSPADR